MKYFFNNKRQKEKVALHTVTCAPHCAHVILCTEHERMTGLSWEDQFSFHSRGTCSICGWEANVRQHHRVPNTGGRQGPLVDRSKTHLAYRSHCWCTSLRLALRTLLQENKSSWPLHDLPDYSFSSFENVPHRQQKPWQQCGEKLIQVVHNK